MASSLLFPQVILMDCTSYLMVLQEQMRKEIFTSFAGAEKMRRCNRRRTRATWRTPRRRGNSSRRGRRSGSGGRWTSADISFHNTPGQEDICSPAWCILPGEQSDLTARNAPSLGSRVSSICLRCWRPSTVSRSQSLMGKDTFPRTSTWVCPQSCPCWLWHPCTDCKELIFIYLPFLQVFNSPDY